MLWSSLPLLESFTTASSCSVEIGSRRRREFGVVASPMIKTNKALRRHCGFRCLFYMSKQQSFYPFQNTNSTISCTKNMTEGESVGPRRLNLDHIRGEINKFWESLSQIVRSFPWPEVLENFFELIFGLVFSVAKYLSVPLLAITSLSELSYCAHEKKIRLVPIPLLVGIAMAGVFRDSFLELYPELKEKDFPWHLMVVASLFILLKLPGPYYPYWGRICIPHFANGGLLRCLWFSLLWYRRSPTLPEPPLQHSSTSENQSQ